MRANCWGAHSSPPNRLAPGKISPELDPSSSGLKISTTALFGIGAPDVAYVRLVETDAYLNDDIDAVPATMHVTLVWRPVIAVVPISSWRIHHLGEAIEPTLVPRTAAGFDPRTQA